MDENTPVPQPSTLTLLMADTDETQAYVFESHKLPEIRGASRQLHDLNEQLKSIIDKARGRTVYAGGGGLLALVDPDKAETLVADMEALYPRRTGAATITAVARPLPPDHDDQQFGRSVTWLTHALRRRKLSKTTTPFWERLPHQVRCESCRKRPALVDPAGNWCSVCTKKRWYEGRFAWFKRFEEKTPKSHAYYAGEKGPFDHPQDLNELGQACRARPGYVAFIYLDGDSIGRLLQQIHTEAQYHSFSKTMQQVTEEAVFAALAKHLHLTAVTGSPTRAEVGKKELVGKRILIHPFEIITIGGDDVMLIVPAHAALSIALDIGRKFGESMTDFVRQELAWQRTVSMSGGVVIADDHTPVQVLRDLAGQLQDEAKKLDDGGLDFLVLKSADMLDDRLSMVREQYPYLIAGGDRRTGKDLRLLARPYSYAQLQTMWENLRQLKQAGFANSQVHLLAESLLDGRAPATLFYEYQRHRSGRDKAAYGRLHQLLLDLYGADDRNPLPWQSVVDADYSYQTALWDIAELYEFIPAST